MKTPKGIRKPSSCTPSGEETTKTMRRIAVHHEKNSMQTNAII